MNFEQSMQVVQQYQQDQGFPGLLETLEHMREELVFLPFEQRQAFRVVFNEMAKLFAPVDQ